MFYDGKAHMRRQINAVELQDFYHEVGATIWHIQYLEDTLVSFLALKICNERRCAGQTVTMLDAEMLLDEKRKLTLGPLIDGCIKYKIIQLAEQARYAAFKLERHWLVHRSLIESGDDLYDDATRQAVFMRIAAIREEAEALKLRVFDQMQRWTTAHGVSQEAADEEANEQIRRLKGEPPRHHSI